MTLVWGLLIFGGAAVLAGRLHDLSDGRRLWQDGNDPTFQGDGWRWTLSLLLPNLLLPWRLLHPRPLLRAVAEMMADEVGCLPPVTVDMLPLTAGQRITCWQEWLAAQRQYERWETEQGGQ